MRFVLKEKIWSFADDFVIRDENGNVCYEIFGRFFSWGDKLSFRDPEGNELAFISQRLLSWGPTYEIHRPDAGPALVEKELFTFFNCRFIVDGPGDEDYEASGDFLDHEYEIQGAGELAARVSKQWFSWSDTYGIEIADDVDPVLLLAIAVVIDLVCHGRRE